MDYETFQNATPGRHAVFASVPPNQSTTCKQLAQNRRSSHRTIHPPDTPSLIKILEYPSCHDSWLQTASVEIVFLRESASRYQAVAESLSKTLLH
jgi:hypothetical protein